MVTPMPITVRTYGAGGPFVVVLHGGPGAPGSAAGLARALEHRFHVLEPLQRPSGEVHLSVRQHVEDLAAVAPPRAALVGWSWGAMLGLSFAAQHPDRVSALALVGCGTYGETDREIFRRSMDRRLERDGCCRMAALADQVDHTRDSTERDRVLAEMGRLATEAQSFDLMGDAENELPVDAQGHHETWQDVLRLQEQGIEPAAFGNIRAPVLMLHGEYDPHPGDAIRDTLRRVIPQLEYSSLARCGHLPWRERQAHAEFLRILQNWLALHVPTESLSL